ncbi:MAG: response regulator, partial [Myxococcota bacterium]
RYRQVLFNLVGNGIKFTSQGEVRIRIRGERLDDEVRVHTSVVDTGLGIAPEKQKKIFLPFEQSDNSTSRRFGGTGLGLTISKGIVDLLGGQLEVESEIGRGSRFFFSIRGPVAPTNQSPIALPKTTDLPSSIIVAEDNPVNQKVIRGLMRSVKADVEFASNGRELLERLEERSFEVVLMDCHMPEMDGFEATAKIRQRFPGESRPQVIAVTASAMAEERDRCFEVGMDDFVAKPVSKAVLLEALGRARARRAGHGAKVTPKVDLT